MNSMLNAFSGIAQVSNVEKVEENEEETEEEIDKRIQALTEKRVKIRMQKQREERAVVIVEELKASVFDKVRQLNITKEEIYNEISKLNGELDTLNDVEDPVKFVELNYPDKLANSIQSVALQQLVLAPAISQQPRALQPRKAQWNGLIDEKQKMFLVYKGKKAEFHKENVGVKMTTDWNGKKCSTRYESANCLVKTMYRDLGATNTPNVWEVVKVMKGTKKVSLGDFVA
jgi:hypothetical protein